MAIALDKMIAIAVPGAPWALEGIFTGASGADPGGAIVAAPHPLYGGSMDSPVVAELAWACQSAGYATVRFNWRGVGALVVLVAAQSFVLGLYLPPVPRSPKF